MRRILPRNPLVLGAGVFIGIAGWAVLRNALVLPTTFADLGKWGRSTVFICAGIVTMLLVCTILSVGERRIAAIAAHAPSSRSMIQGFAAAVLGAVCLALLALLCFQPG